MQENTNIYGITKMGLKLGVKINKKKDTKTYTIMFEETLAARERKQCAINILQKRQKHAFEKCKQKHAPKIITNFKAPTKHATQLVFHVFSININSLFKKAKKV